MRPDFTLFFALLFAFVKSDDREICDGWARKGPEIYCTESLFKEYCPDAAAKNCQRSGQVSREKIAETKGQPGGRASSANAEFLDNLVICPKWKKAGSDVYCRQNRQILTKYCPSLILNCKGEGKLAIVEDRNQGYVEPSTLPTTKAPKTTSTKATTTKATTTTTKTTQAPLTFKANVMQCCKENGVRPNCLGLCEVPKNIEGLCEKSNDCEDDFEILTYCTLNAHDYSSCCAERGVPKSCADQLCGATKYPHPNALVPLKACVDKHEAGALSNCPKDLFTGKKEWEVRSDWKKEVWTPGIKQAVVNIYCQEILKAKKG